MENNTISNNFDASELKRIDSAFQKLHVAATNQVTVYSYNSFEESWDKTDKVGSLFLYERNADPQKHGLIVMNRKNAKNFLQTFGPGAQFVVEQPYILIRAVEDLQTDPRDGADAIFCIWFYEPNDCIVAGQLLEKMGRLFEGDEETLDMKGRPSISHLQKGCPSSMGNNARHFLSQILKKGKGLPIGKEDISNVTTSEKCLFKKMSQE